MYKRLNILLFIILFLPAIGFSAPSALFLNPGKTSESFWQDVDIFAQAAATRLSVDLQIFHAERDNYRVIKEVERLIKNNLLPDYLLVVNEKKILPKLLTLLEGKEVYLLVILNDLSPEQKSKYLTNKHWQKYLLTSLIPDNYWIGQQTAKGLIAAGQNQAGEVLVISGDNVTPASVQRQAGAVDYFNSQPHIKLKQVVYAHWDEQISYQKSFKLIQRSTHLKYIWTANDHMAFGSLSALKAHNLQPGRDVFVSTINTSKKVLALKSSGEINVLGGGHFTAAGWALVMLNNHSKGEVLPRLVDDPLFQLIEPKTDFYTCLVGKDWSDLPFEKIQANQEGAYIFKMEAHQGKK